LTWTAQIPAGTTVGFLILALSYTSTGGYKVMKLDADDNEVVDDANGSNGGAGDDAPADGGADKPAPAGEV
jgi:hypothetical protein